MANEMKWADLLHDAVSISAKRIFSAADKILKAGQTVMD